ncbi:MAG TPA: ABC transporter ATP-binding protein [Leptolyngbyaceae cyanobacterium]
MSDVVIRVDNLGKKYIIGHRQESYRSFRDAISEVAKSATQQLLKPLLKRQTISSPAYEEFWALKDVSFDIHKGDRVGIIGRNGAGKSTLLKILSRITEPSTGRISIKGRVASLLEVGTGFHPELTGRENIYLNGAILGMSKVEIKNKFDEIVAFAEVEKFLDTPVKRYSSGMYVRLAFAVAAHLEPEILIVDEVLAVGDAQFQKKCLGKMEEVGKEGRTVIFVSHQMSAIEKLCSRTIVLGYGQIKFDGQSKLGINYYLKDLDNRLKNIDIRNIERSGSGKVIITNFYLENKEGEQIIAASSGEEIVLVFEYEISTKEPAEDVSIGLSIHSILGETISILYSDYVGQTFNLTSYQGKLKCKIKNFPYSTGRYLVGARIISNGVEADWPKDFIGFIDVEAGDFYRNGSIFHSGIGLVLLQGEWQLEVNGGIKE